MFGGKESGDEDEEDAEQDTENDDTAAAVLGRGHRNALLANRTRVTIYHVSLSHRKLFVI